MGLWAGIKTEAEAGVAIWSWTPWIRVWVEDLVLAQPWAQALQVISHCLRMGCSIWALK